MPASNDEATAACFRICEALYGYRKHALRLVLDIHYSTEQGDRWSASIMPKLGNAFIAETHYGDAASPTEAISMLLASLRVRANSVVQAIAAEGKILDATSSP